jgi:hypothetical protein
VVPVEIKAGGRPRVTDTQHLHVFLKEYGKAAPHAVLLHTGQRCEPLADQIWAVPLSAALGVSLGTGR